MSFGEEEEGGNTLGYRTRQINLYSVGQESPSTSFSFLVIPAIGGYYYIDTENTEWESVYVSTEN